MGNWLNAINEKILVFLKYRSGWQFFFLAYKIANISDISLKWGGIWGWIWKFYVIFGKKHEKFLVLANVSSIYIIPIYYLPC